MTSVMCPAQAGTVESGDILVTITPADADSGIVIELESLVQAQYGAAIRETIQTTLAAAGVAAVYVKALDRGALDCTIRARVKAALQRAGVAAKEVAV